MRVIIAEKREVAKAIVKALGGGQLKGSAFAVGSDYVTWLSGHLLRLTDPEEHDETLEKWNLDALPMAWPISYKPLKQHKDHLDKVITLCKQADTLVHAGDPDPEGQRLVDEVLTYAKLSGKPCQRLLINDNTASAIQSAMNRMEDNTHYQGLSMSALARAVCDQRYGYNLTRCYTLIGRAAGFNGVLSVGRVQTPILGLLVRRDRAIDGHSKQSYHTIKAIMAVGTESDSSNTDSSNTDSLKTNSPSKITAWYQPSESDPIDEKGRVIDGAFADNVLDAVKHQEAKVLSVKTKEGSTAPLLPHNLLSLQAEAAGLWNIKPKQVLEITQRLRDQHQAITYNRSDCRYLNTERHGEAPRLLSALVKVFGDKATKADPSLKSKAFDRSKVGAHHGIIPTLNVPDINKLSQDEQRIYQRIVLAYLAQFYPPQRFRTTVVLWTVSGKTFRSTGRVDIARGWKVLYGKENEEDTTERINLESLREGATGTVGDGEVKQEFTKPPPRYSMKALLQDLTRVAKYVSDPKIKALLLSKDSDKDSESGGIGTPATRDSHIETLFTRGFVVEQGKQLVSTELGRKFYDALPSFAVQPDMTALWHEKQQQIEAGKLDYQTLIDQVNTAITEEIKRAKASQGSINVADTSHQCPVCKQGHLSKRQGKTGAFWGCSRYPDCRTTFPDNKNSPNLAVKKAEVSKEHACPQCGKGMVRRPAKRKGQYWWGCSGFPACDYRAFDDNGKPKVANA